MANVVYPAYRKALLEGSGPDLTSVNVKMVLVDLADYTYSSAHDFLDDVPSGARVGTSGNLSSKTTTGGVFDAADPTITAVSGDPIEAVVVYHDTGTASTSRLLAFIDTKSDGTTPISFTPNGSDVTVNIPAGGIFSL